MEINTEMDAQAAVICRKWAKKLGLGFHWDTAGEDYDPPLTAEEIEDYEWDKDVIFQIVRDPYAFAVDAMKKDGLI